MVQSSWIVQGANRGMGRRECYIFTKAMVSKVFTLSLKAPTDPIKYTWVMENRKGPLG